jgi:hypothetical protein
MSEFIVLFGEHAVGKRQWLLNAVAQLDQNPGREAIGFKKSVSPSADRRGTTQGFLTSHLGTELGLNRPDVRGGIQRNTLELDLSD